MVAVRGLCLADEVSDTPIGQGGPVTTIKVKAYAVLLDVSRTRHAVWSSRDDTKRPPEFHRLLGGHVEFGESAADAVVREISEELGAELTGVALLGVLESRFTYGGEPGHEVAFVHVGHLPEHVVPDAGGWYDDGGPIRVDWRAVATDTATPLYPEGTQHLLDRWLASRGGRT